MKLSQLLRVIGARCPQDPDITALACDSREVVPGALFVAMEGARADGRAYLSDALDRGAAAVVFRHVSYTHLRAHETSQDLVLRRLLEKKNGGGVG
ncbi:MAG: hypothetical protein K2P49_03155, partial [Oscillospiraceae bacterium]|nr:hypothetical protein [Oscillospiraceae bacterium]